MNARPDEELLSAYLDGEVTASERAEVERHLAENAESRRLLEQLRGVREEVSALPRYQLDADFSRRVLEAAERELLEAPVAAANQPVADHAAADPTNVGPVSPADPSRRTRGGWLPDPRSRLHPRRLLRSASWALIATAAGLLLMFAFPAREQIATGPNAEVRQLNVPVHGEMSAPESENTTGQRVTTTRETAPASLARPGADARRTLTTPAPGSDRPLAKSADSAGAGSATGEAPAATAQSGTADVATPEEQVPEQANAQTSELATQVDAVRSQNAELSRQLVSRAAPRGAGRGLLVVQMDLSPEAVDQQALDQLFTRNAIRVAPGSATPQLAAGGQQPLEMVYVEATPAQLEATLTELAEEPRYFQNVAVADQLFPTQQQFRVTQQQPQALSLPPQGVTNDVTARSPYAPPPSRPAPAGIAGADSARNAPRGQAIRLHLEPESQEFIARSQTQFHAPPSAVEPTVDAAAMAAGADLIDQRTAPSDSDAPPADLSTDEARESEADSLLGALFIIRVLGLPSPDTATAAEPVTSPEAAAPVAGPQPAEESPAAADSPPAAVETPSTTPTPDGETAP